MGVVANPLFEPQVGINVVAATAGGGLLPLG